MGIRLTTIRLTTVVRITVFTCERTVKTCHSINDSKVHAPNWSCFRFAKCQNYTEGQRHIPLSSGINVSCPTPSKETKISSPTSGMNRCEPKLSLIECHFARFASLWFSNFCDTNISERTGADFWIFFASWQGNEENAKRTKSKLLLVFEKISIEVALSLIECPL